MNTKMKKGFFIVMMANMINLIIGLITNFILPKYLSIDSYAVLKTYNLYITYSSFFSLGYVDGMYLEYGGKKFEEVNKSKYWREFQSFNFLEIIFLVIIFIIGLILKNRVILMFGFGMLSNALVGFFRSSFQATGEFKIYGRSLNLEKIALLILYLITLFVFKCYDPYVIILLQIVIPFAIVIYFILAFRKMYHGPFFVLADFSLIRNYIKEGVVLLISNFSLGLLTGVDRWIIKIFLSTTDFAEYSFAVSTESIISVFLSPLTVIMYNYLCKKKRNEDVKRIKNISVLWTFLVIAAIYPCEWILIHYLDKYYGAKYVIFLLGASQIFSLLIRGIYVNLYKVEHKQNRYLIQVIIFLIIAAVMDLLAVFLWGSKEAIAAATLITSILWLNICEAEYSEYSFGLRQVMMILIMSLTFIGSSFMNNPYLACSIYLSIYIILSALLMKAEFYEMLDFIKNLVLSKIKIRREER